MVKSFFIKAPNELNKEQDYIVMENKLIQIMRETQNKHEYHIHKSVQTPTKNNSFFIQIFNLQDKFSVILEKGTNIATCSKFHENSVVSQKEDEIIDILTATFLKHLYLYN